NPHLIQFGFVFDVHAKKAFASLKKPEIWESLKRRITRVDKPTPNDKSQTIFFVENNGNPNDSGLFHESYKVNVATGDIPFPSSWEMTTTQFPGMKTEVNVSDTKRY